MIEVDAQTGKARALIDEQSKTFIYYNQLGDGLSAGRRYRHDVNDGKEIIWASERDGWEHLYLYDGVTGKVKNQITKGDWLVRNVDRVDDDKRQIWFEAGGMIPGQDPYFTQYCRINFDGTGLTKLTDADGTHTVTFSQDRKYYVDMLAARRSCRRRLSFAAPKIRRWSWISTRAMPPRCWPPASSSRKSSSPRAATARPISGASSSSRMNFDPNEEVSGDREHLRRAAGLLRPQNLQRRFGRPGDGGTRLHRGPHRRHGHQQPLQGLPRCRLQEPRATPASPTASCGTKPRPQSIRGTTSRRVGIFGTSAGGQNSLGGMLFHPEFYKVVVTNSGCHDNRMDKIWWNEQWMGWPLGPQYAASSNVDNAYRLQGKRAASSWARWTPTSIRHRRCRW